MSAPIGGSSPKPDASYQTPTPAANEPVSEGAVQSSPASQTPAMAPTQGNAQQNVDDLLNQAGLTNVGAAQDVGPTQGAQGTSAANAAQQLYGTGDIALPPPSAPTVNLTPELAQGAEAFATNMDLALNNLLDTPTRSLATQGVNIESLASADIGNLMTMMGPLVAANAPVALPGGTAPPIADSQMPAGTLSGPAPAGASGDTQASQIVQPMSDSAMPGDTPGQGQLRGAVANTTFPDVLPNNITPENAAEVFNAAITMGFNPFTGTTIKDVPQDIKMVMSPEYMAVVAQTVSIRMGMPQGGLSGASAVAGDIAGALEGMSSEALLAAFLKINIDDPNNSVEIQNDLHQLSSDLRQKAMDEAQTKADIAEKLQAEAAGYASKIGPIVEIIQIVCIVLAVFTAGATLIAAGALGAAVATATAAATTAIAAAQSAIAVIIAVLQIVAAGAQAKSAEKSSDANEASNDSDRSRLQAEQAQHALEEQAAVISLIMESKNAMVDAVLKMMNASFATNNKVMSAGMAR